MKKKYSSPRVAFGSIVASQLLAGSGSGTEQVGVHTDDPQNPGNAL